MDMKTSYMFIKAFDINKFFYEYLNNIHHDFIK